MEIDTSNQKKFEQNILENANYLKDDPEEFSNRLATLLDRLGINNQLSHLKGHTYFTIGQLLYEHGFFHHSILAYLQSLEDYRKNNQTTNLVDCYIGISNVYVDLGNSAEAIKYVNYALKKSQEIDYKNGVERCFSTLGALKRINGQYKSAIEYFEKALLIAKEIGYEIGIASYYTNIGISHMYLNNYEQSIDYHERALKIFSQTEYEIGQCRCLINVGSVYEKIGEFDKSLEYQKKALNISIKIGDKVTESLSYGNMGRTFVSLGHFKKAIISFEKELKISKQIDYVVGQGKSYTSLGFAHFLNGDYEASLEFLNLGLQIKQEIQDRHGELICYLIMGGVFGSQENLQKSIEYSSKALDISIEIGDIFSESQANFNLGSAYLKIDKKISLSYFSRSITLREIIGANLIEEQHKIFHYGDNATAYQVMVKLCLDLNKKEEALEFVERSKSKAFLDLISSSRIKPTVPMTKELKLLIEKEETYLTILREIQLRHLKKIESTVKIGEVGNINKKLTKIYEQIAQIDPEYVLLRGPKTFSLQKIQQILSEKSGGVLVEYFITDDELIIFTVDPKNLFVTRIPIPRKELLSYVEKFKMEISNTTSSYTTSWLALGKKLLSPISEFLSNAEFIYFVPHDYLHYIPIHALPLNGEPLIASKFIVYLPSSSLLPFFKRKSNLSKKCAVFGVDFLSEAEHIASIFGVQPYLNVDKDTVIKNINHDILHFSCHGIFNDIDPLSSGIKLQDGILTAREIFDLKIKSNLVTLSACETGVNQRTPGDDLIGLTRSILYAGASSVLVSLWEVDAFATRDLMVYFYKNLQSGMPIAISLQEAQKRLMTSEQYSHPNFWSAFILVGDSEL